ncbi:MAG: porphobilinogen synthase [Actinomycetes bacterium]
MAFPVSRPRRLRTSVAMRELVAETRLHTSNFVAPLFVKEGISSPQPIASLPGVMQHSLDSLEREVQELAALGVRGVILFGVPEKKDDIGSGAFDPQGIVQVALERLTKSVGSNVVLMADLCVDEYTSHGHCGIVGKNGDVDNDLTLDVYAKIAVAQASAGAQVVAPSGMMDGQVGVIRSALDAKGLSDVSIMAYSAKYASGLYGPFRDAVDVSIANGGHRKGYQQDFRNARESLIEVQADIDQGADIVMVKPAITYLDVISAVRAMTQLPIAAYHVSGEYAMIKAAAANGWIDHDTVALEQLTAIRRAGADIILTYFTRWFAENNG